MKTINHSLIVSKEFTKKRELLDIWLTESKENHALIGGIQAFLQPNLYTNMKEMFRQLEQNHNLVSNPDCLPRALRHWNLPFNALSIISN